MRRFHMTVRTFGAEEEYLGCMFENDHIAIHHTGISELIFYPSIEAMKLWIGKKDVNASISVSFIDE